jgi:hypothetical protein
LSDKWDFLYGLSQEELNALIAKAEAIREEKETRALEPSEEKDTFFDIEEEEEDFPDEEEQEEAEPHDNYDDFLEREREQEEEFEEPPDEPEIYSPADFDPRDIRKVRYATEEDAFNYIDKRGLQEYASVIYFPGEDLFGLAFPKKRP